VGVGIEEWTIVVDDFVVLISRFILVLLSETIPPVITS
jgi:hypothetical protein